jgi:hypothetical protein
VVEPRSAFAPSSESGTNRSWTMLVRRMWAPRGVLEPLTSDWVIMGINGAESSDRSGVN